MPSLIQPLAQAMLASSLQTGAENVFRFYIAQSLAFQGRHSEAEALLIAIEDKAPPSYRPRVLLSMAAVRQDLGDPQSAARLCREAVAATSSRDYLTLLQASRILAVARSMNGDNVSALAHLERLTPLARHIGNYYPADYLNHLNSLAVELGQAGRIDEARRASRIAVSSPLTAGYPEWLATSRELETLPRRAFVPFTIALGAPEPEQKPDLLPESSPAHNALAPATYRQECERTVEPNVQAVPNASRDICLAPPTSGCVTWQANQSTYAVARLLRSKPAIRASRGYAISPPARAPPDTTRL
ncbi:MAG: hypothetical protein ACREDR_03410 [Blastocatellia bacterium]